MTDSPRILTFAGQPVPEDGLTVAPPQGGELTVWPDGGFAFIPPADSVLPNAKEPLTTYYSYVMEDVDGEVTVGTFALTPGEAALDPMPDFEAWSMEDILALEDAVGLVVDLPGPVAELAELSDGGHASYDPGLDMGGSFDSDVLDHVIKTSCES